MVYPSPKASAFWQNIQRIFEIYKGKTFPLKTSEKSRFDWVFLNVGLPKDSVETEMMICILVLKSIEFEINTS